MRDVDQPVLPKNKDLLGSLAAMQRAAQMARQQAVRTGTAVVYMRDGVMVRVTADELRQAGVK